MMQTSGPSDPSEPWSRDALADGGPYNALVVRSLLDQGVLALQDLLDTKKQFESKAIALLAVFVPAAAATIGSLILSKDILRFEYVWGLAGILFVFASIFLVFALREMDYGAPGIEPRDWLCERWLKPSQEHGITFGDAEKASRLHAMLAHDLGKQIEQTTKSNEHKVQQISAAIYFGAVAAVVVLVGTALEVLT